MLIVSYALYVLFLIPIIILQHGRYYTFYTGEETDTKGLSNLSKFSYPSFFFLYLYFFYVETGSPYVAQAGLKLLGSRDPPASASQSAGITVTVPSLQFILL